MKLSPIKIILSVVVWLVLVSGVSSLYAWQWLHAEQVFPIENHTYTVKPGASLSRVVADLHDAGGLRWPKLLLLYAKLKGLTEIKAGEFVFDNSESPVSVLEKINSNDVVQYQITFTEGSRYRDVLEKIKQHGKITQTLSDGDMLVKLQQINEDITHMEGWIYPDTYQFTAGDTDVSLLLRAHQRMHNVLADEWESRQQGLPYDSPYEALIMASIVEKETGAAHERAEIAGVFVRRLQKGMRLQTDPTVIYGMGAHYNGNITRKDLRQHTPYNTYRIAALPPTPIALAGRAALHAALNPLDGTSLYFVAKGDGTHKFSATIEEHNKAVHQYQKIRRSDYRSAPPTSNQEN